MSKIIIDMPNPKLKRRIEWLMGFEWNKEKTEEELKQNIIDMYKENGDTIAEGAFDELIPEYNGEMIFPVKEEV